MSETAPVAAVLRPPPARHSRHTRTPPRRCESSASGSRSFVFEHFSEQLLNPSPGRRQGLAPERSRPIHTAIAAVFFRALRLQIALLLHPVEDRVQRSGAEPIAMARKFIHHPLP